MAQLSDDSGVGFSTRILSLERTFCTIYPGRAGGGGVLVLVGLLLVWFLVLFFVFKKSIQYS